MSRQPMSHLLFNRLVWIMLVPSFGFLAIIIVDLLLHPQAPGGVPGGGLLYRLVIGLLIGPGTVICGVMIARRVPGNVIGPLLMLYGIGVAGGSVRYDVETSGVAALFQFNSFYIVAVQISALGYLLLHFPSGMAYPRRAARWITVYAIFNVFFALLGLLSSEYANQFGDITFTNPFYIMALKSLRPVIANWDLPSTLTIFLLVASAVSLLTRYRSSTRNERQQIKWLAFSGALMGVSMFGWPLAFAFGFVEIWRVVYYSVTGALPAMAISVSILRYRLWDIDIIIRRTLVYAILTGILAVIYFGGIILAQQVFRISTGQTSDLAIVISTLLIAALFTPIRRSVQDVIDRRLYRRKYDAAKTLQRFNATLRDEVNLDELKQALTGVVDDTMQPARIALWLPTAMPNAMQKTETHSP
jgi:hypothetical protein